jgi:DNA-binding FadR family transcriptional regulator
VRQVIEPAIVEMATRRATDDQRSEIASIAATTTRQLEEFRQLDHQFHSALARSCGNPLLHEVHTKALASLFGSGDFSSLLYAEVNRSEVNEIISSSLAAHRAIAEAVVRGHTRKAVAAVVAHLDDVERRMVERLL